jgi:FkbM family methyltransferase
MALPRLVLERLSRDRAFWRSMPAEFGRAPLRVTPDAALRWLKPGTPAFDPMLLEMSTRYVAPGAVVWDIGANVGVFSVAAAHRDARVLSVEPDPWLHSLLAATIRHPRNERLSISVLCVAIAGEVGTARLAIASRGRASNYLESYFGRSDAGGVRTTCLVPVLTLDTLLRTHDRPTVVKIDVEGAEAAALNGAEKLLCEVRPTILIEVGSETRSDVIKRLQGAKYQVMDYETDKACDANSPAATNLIAHPR